MIEKGAKIPEATIAMMGEKGPDALSSSDYFAGCTVVLFALPGAFTPTCSAQHLPGFINHASDIKAKGVDKIACLSVNDAFVMGAWGKQQSATGVVDMLADGSADFTKKLGLSLDLTDAGFGIRSQRYAMIVKDGIVSDIFVEEGGDFKVSSAENILRHL